MNPSNLFKICLIYSFCVGITTVATPALATCASTISNNTNSTSQLSSSADDVCIENGVNGIITYTGVGGTDWAIKNDHNIDSLINAGIINAVTGGGNNNPFAIWNAPNGTLGRLTNSGTIMSNGTGAHTIINSHTITQLTNTDSGSIKAQGLSANAITQAYNSFIGILDNDGTISSDSGDGISNTSNSRITSLINRGMITGSVYGINNTGTGRIGTLENLQGRSSSALTYTGNLPSNYNIIINSRSNYGQLAVTSPVGSTIFGISALSGTYIDLTGTTYQNVLTGLAASNITNENEVLTYKNGNLEATYSLVENGTTNAWDLTILSYLNGVTATDTQVSLTRLNSNLKGAFIGQTLATNFANMNTYDCDLFDKSGFCLSVGSRYTTADDPSSNSTSAVVVVGYKSTPHIRIGGFLDQNINNNTSSSVHISNKNPLLGVYGVWNLNADGLGYQMKLANAYQDKNIKTTREIIGTSEAGEGDTNLNTQSYVGELSYALMFNDKTLIRPYIALRHTTIQQDGYTESANIDSPLTYGKIEDKSLTSLLGTKVNYALTSKLNLTGSVGVEHDLDHDVDQLTTTGVSGLTSENFNSNIKRTRAVATVGAQFSPAKNQRIAGELYYQQLPFQSTASATAYVHYTIGF